MFARILLGLWLSACLAVLVFAFVQRTIPDADIVFSYLMLFLTFPIGYVFLLFLGSIFEVLFNFAGTVVPGGFAFSLCVWPLFVAVGYFQWFQMIPWLYRKLARLAKHS
jgi:hypothetical protein